MTERTRASPARVSMRRPCDFSASSNKCRVSDITLVRGVTACFAPTVLVVLDCGSSCGQYRAIAPVWVFFFSVAYTSYACSPVRAQTYKIFFGNMLQTLQSATGVADWVARLSSPFPFGTFSHIVHFSIPAVASADVGESRPAHAAQPAHVFTERCLGIFPSSTAVPPAAPGAARARALRWRAPKRKTRAPSM